MSLYTQLAEIPVPVAAQFISLHDAEPAVVQVTYSVKDHARNVKRTMSKSIIVNKSSLPTATPLQDIDIVSQITSPSRQKTATLRNVKNSSGNTTRIVEVWNLGRLEVSLNVTDHHGDFYTDEFIGSLAFAPSELAIAYTAEGNPPETEGDPYQKFRFNPDFGESLTGKRRPTTFILRWQNPSPDDTTPPRANLAQLKQVDGVRFGQVIFSAHSDETLYATGYEFTSDGRMLGIKGCFNRPSGIWRLCVSLPTGDKFEADKLPTIADIAEARKLTPALSSCRSPRVWKENDGIAQLIWLESRTGGAHVATSTLQALYIESSADADDIIRTLVKVVDVPWTNGFPGLYPPYNIPSSFAIQNGIILGSQWKSRTAVLGLIDHGYHIREFTPMDKDLYSWTALATDGDKRIICTRSSPSIPYEIVLGTFDHASEYVTWEVIDKPTLTAGVSKALSTLRTSIIQVSGSRPLLETILIQGNADKNAAQKPPCITSPHGGPHGTTSTAFSPNTAALVLEGYTLSFPNYRGSPGYGEDFIQHLIGLCGELDVQDCIESARCLIHLGISESGPGKQFVMGGSHGGFLTAHLIGQFPEFFSAAVLRNPVITASATVNTDIPDWYFAEFGLAYPLASSEPGVHTSLAVPAGSVPPRVDAAAFARLEAASPTAHLDAISVPVLLLIGGSDRRVSPTQGIEFYHALKARGQQVDMLVFEGEGHPLDGVEASRVSFEATRDWLARSRK